MKGHIRILHEVESALEEDRIELLYQPKICPANNWFVGTEAVCRLRHPVKGLMSPSYFIEHVEHSKLIDRFTAHILNKAGDKISRWHRADVYSPVSVNISGRNFASDTLPSVVRACLNEWGFPPQLLTLELTEREMGDVEAMREQLARIRQMGVKISIDDFLVGFNSMDQLDALPEVDEVKLDMNFARNIELQPRKQAIAQTLINLCHELGYVVVAEGIESKAAKSLFAEMRCDAIQGFYVARPLPPREFIEWLTRRWAA